MSACPKLSCEYDDLPAAGGVNDSSGALPPAAAVGGAPGAGRSGWWRGAIHLAALLGFLCLCAILSLVGLLWFSMAMEPG